MSLREIGGMMVRAFCIIVTGTVFGIWLGGIILMPDGRFIPLGFGHILLTAFVAVLFFLLFYSKKDLTRTQMLVRIVIHFCTLSPTMILLVYHWNWIPKGNLVFLAAAVFFYLLIYAAVFFGVLVKDGREAKRMNEALRQRQNRYRQGEKTDDR